ncbi:YceI-like domain-containing protein [Chitinophaga dinghuensis]|uniref:YceI-like domain-containing protein n=1 Tax=Chitinophaga dinghuensis TaxID=1539050 RepID=A0A327VL28_9BACT|nr:YceI family protein [Chitinophaga dinghuensis]RAJ75202.1 YceI-like domain-containing protein [Chitinophaga dinghuensis]
MKYMILFVLGLLMSVRSFSQDVVTAKGATISFFSSAPLEDISARTDKAVSAINTKTRAIYFKVPINSFEFEQDLMQQHFNSSYMESGKYPFSEFKGTINDNVDLTKDGTYNVTVSGTLNMHGVDKTYQEKGTIIVQGGVLKAHAKFVVKLADHKIKIPTIVMKHIAEQVEVTVDGTYTAQGK